MVEPVVIPRDQHILSRRDIDPDALKVLYRLHQANHVAYLVGGSVRDLLLQRRPKDFDVGTDAHPYQIKRLFRNCWIIGRRFRLAHVRFGTKVIEVATFRRQVPAGTEEEPPLPHEEVEGTAPPGAPDAEADGHARLVHRDNTFGTPEEDAFRRDFTVNALFYDIATFSVIDYVGGIGDLERRLIRCIGDPDERFIEDPVRMMRAIVLAARLDFTVDPPIMDAIARHRHEIAKSAPARVMEEYFKILRSGAAARAFAALADSGLLEVLSPEIPNPLPPALANSLESVDEFRGQFESVPDSLTNPVLLGSLIAPLGLLQRRSRRREYGERPERDPLPTLGALPVARRDVERLTQILALQRRLLDLDASPRAQTTLTHRSAFPDALTWLRLHADAPEVVAHWEAVAADARRRRETSGEPGEEAPPPPRRRRRRRRRGPAPRDR